MSVVVSAYQRQESLRRTLEGLVRQVVPPSVSYEVIVVDNNSTDGTRDVVAEYIRRHPSLVRYAFEPRQGVSFGRNTGIRLVRAPIVAFTDDDNVPTRTWVATLHSCLEKNPDVAGVGGKVLPEWPCHPPDWLDRRHWSPLAVLDYGNREFRTSVDRPVCLITANMAVRRDVLLECGGFAAPFIRCQDHELQLRLWRRGYRFLYAPELVVVARVDPKRLTTAYHRRWYERRGYFAALMGLEEAIDDRGKLRLVPHDTPRLLGSPGYVHRSVVHHGWRWLAARMRHQRAVALHHEHRLRYLIAYLRHTAVLSRPTRHSLVSDAVRFMRSHLERRARAVNMSVARLAAAHVVVAVLLGWSAWDTVTGEEHWPFSPYPMFSSVERTHTLDSLVLRGVPAEGEAREIALRDGQVIGPFDQCRIVTAMQRARNADGGARLQTMLADTLARYEAAREQGVHDGPRLRAIRVYDAHWTLQPDAANADEPDRTRLLAEASAAPAAVASGGF